MEEVGDPWPVDYRYLMVYGKEKFENHWFRIIKSVSDMRRGNKETRLVWLLISSHFDDEENGETLTCWLSSNFTQSFIHVRRLVWPGPVLKPERVTDSELLQNNTEC